MTGCPRRIRLLRLAALAIAISLFPCAASALEVKEGLVKIVINEQNARVSVYRLVDIAKGKYESFLFDQDPRTSFATLSIDGKQARLGDASDYHFVVSRTDTGALIEFRSSFCAVREAVDFAKSVGSALADGVRVAFELENVSEHDASIGLRFLADTYLAEKSGFHFASDKNQKIGLESDITVDTGESWISTPSEKTNFMIQLGGQGVDRPSHVILANWKRITDASWSFEVNAQRNFTLVPYSINDSAAALFWDPEQVARGATRRISFAMGAFNEKGYSSATERSATEKIFESTVLEGKPADASTALAADLVAVRDLITRIDRSIASGSAQSDEIAAWKKILDLLEERKKGY